METVKFQATKHQKLWKAMRNSWYLVKKFGITDTKIYLRRSLLNDTTDIFNSCYACEYDVTVATQRNERHLCKYCPIYIDRCDTICSVLFQLSLAINDNNRLMYERMCIEMADAPIKANIPCDWE